MEYEISDFQKPLISGWNASLCNWDKNAFKLTELKSAIEIEEKALSLIENFKRELENQKIFKMKEIHAALQDANILKALIDLQNKFRYEERNENIQIKYLLPDEIKNKIKGHNGSVKNVPQFRLLRNGNIIYAKHLRYFNNYVWRDEIRDGEDILEKSCYVKI